MIGLNKLKPPLRRAVFYCLKQSAALGGENGMDKKDKSKVEMIEAVSHLIFSISLTLLTLVTIAVIIQEHF